MRDRETRKMPGASRRASTQYIYDIQSRNKFDSFTMGFGVGVLLFFILPPLTYL